MNRRNFFQRALAALGLVVAPPALSEMTAEQPEVHKLMAMLMDGWSYSHGDGETMYLMTYRGSRANRWHNDHIEFFKVPDEWIPRDKSYVVNRDGGVLTLDLETRTWERASTHPSVFKAERGTRMTATEVRARQGKPIV